MIGTHKKKVFIMKAHADKSRPVRTCLHLILKYLTQICLKVHYVCLVWPKSDTERNCFARAYSATM